MASRRGNGAAAWGAVHAFRNAPTSYDAPPSCAATGHAALIAARIAISHAARIAARIAASCSNGDGAWGRPDHFRRG